MKQAAEIYEQMLAIFTEKTGFAMEDTADLAVRLYAAAAEIETLYAYSDWALRQSFPQTATGEHLDLHAQLRGISRKDGKKAVGRLRFKIDVPLEAAVTIAAGTVCTTQGLVRFVTTQEAEIPAGSLYADVPAEAEEAGEAGNVGPESVIWMTRAPNGVSGVTNPVAFSGGSSRESDESLRERVLDSFIRLPNGANAAFYELRAMSHTGVQAVRVIPRYRGIGTVGVVVATADGVPSDELLKEIQDDLDAVREIAVEVTVMRPQTVRVDVSAQLWPEENVTFADAKAAAQTALETYFDGNRLGEPIYTARLGKLLYDTGKIRNYVFEKPTGDLAGEDMALPQLGIVEFTEGE